MAKWAPGNRASQQARAKGDAQITQIAGDQHIHHHHVQRSAGSPPIDQGIFARLITDLSDPFDLEIHRAIDPGPSAAGDLPLLPPYIEREHDTRLRALADKAAAGSSALAMLVGGSSTGKTRACWEALRQLPDGWRLWHPISPSRPEALLHQIDKIEPKTVIWINEAQHYLLTPEGDIGERVAAALRELMREDTRRPVLVLGTLWLQFWNTLTADPSPSSDDPHTQARALLAGSRITVPQTFDDDALAALKLAALVDPRHANAAQHAEQGMITQYLAGGPALIDRYETAPPVGRALIEAAMDARRLGHGPALPLPLLESALHGYLTTVEWDQLGQDNWLADALAYTSAPIRGARGPLTLIRPQPDSYISDQQPLYRLADYLEQFGRYERRTNFVPAAFWSACEAHSSPSDRTAIGDAAERRGLLKTAFRLYADAPDRVASMLMEADREDEALKWYKRAADSGDTSDFGMTAWLLERTGHIDDALRWYQRAADAGDADGYGNAAQMLDNAGQVNEALKWYERATSIGEIRYAYYAAEMLADANRIDEALDWYLRSTAPAVAKYEYAIRSLEQASVMLAKVDRIDESLELVKRIVDIRETTPRIARMAGVVDISLFIEALDAATKMLMNPEPTEDALRLLNGAAGSSNATALSIAAWALMRGDRGREASTSLLRLIGDGDAAAMCVMAGLQVEAGQIVEALSWYQHATEAGSVSAFSAAARMLQRKGRTDEALAWYDGAANAGDTEALMLAAEMLTAAERIDDALIWYARADDAGVQLAILDAADTLRKAGRHDEALQWYRRAIDAGHTEATLRASEMLEEAGRIDDALNWCRDVAKSSDIDAFALGTTLHRGGQLSEALDWYMRAAQSGHFYALRHAADVLRELGRFADAENLRRYGWEPDQTIAEQWEAELPATT